MDSLLTLNVAVALALAFVYGCYQFARQLFAGKFVWYAVLFNPLTAFLACLFLFMQGEGEWYVQILPFLAAFLGTFLGLKRGEKDKAALDKAYADDPFNR